MTIVVFVGSPVVVPLVAGQAAGALPGIASGSAYAQTLTTTGGTGPYTYSVVSGSLPAGVSLASNGVFSGTPTTGGTSSFTVRRTDSAGTPATLDTAYSITVSASLTPGQAAGALTPRNVSYPFTQTLTTTGGTGPYTYAVVAGAIPAGTTLSSAGVLSGNPTTVQNASFTVRRTDSVGSQIDTAYTVDVRSSTGIGPTGNSYDASGVGNAQITSGNTTGSQWLNQNSNGYSNDAPNHINSYKFVYSGDSLSLPLDDRVYPPSAVFKVTAINSVAAGTFGGGLYRVNFNWERVA